MFILYNKETQLDNLIFNITSHMPLISYAQNDFIRDLSMDVDSLFDMILKLDYKLKFNSNLFYLYISNLYYVKNNKAYVNMEFVDNFMIWEDEESRSEFTDKMSRFINENPEFVEKIIYSHFIEYSSFVKSFIPRIRASLTHNDIYKIICLRNKNQSKFNIFKIIFENMNYICKMLNLDMNTLIMNNEKVNELDSDFKINIVQTYNVFLDEIRNFILLDGSVENNINLLYKELTNINVSYLVDIWQQNNPQTELSDDDTLSTIISYEQEKIESESTENESPNYREVDVRYKEIDELYGSNNESNNSEDKINDESTDDIIDNIINVDGNEVQVEIDNIPDKIVDFDGEQSNNFNTLISDSNYEEEIRKALGEDDTLDSNLDNVELEILEKLKNENDKFSENFEDNSDFKSIFNNENEELDDQLLEYEKRIRSNIELIEKERQKIKEKTEKLKLASESK